MQKNRHYLTKKADIEQLLQKKAKWSILVLFRPFWPTTRQNFEFLLIFCKVGVLIVFLKDIDYDDNFFCLLI